MKKKAFFIALLFISSGYFSLREKPISSSSELASETKEAVCDTRKASSSGENLKMKEVAKSDFESFYADYHEPTQTEVDMPIGKMVLTTFSQNGIPIKGMRIRRVIKKDGSEKILENTYRAIPEVKISPGTSIEKLFIYVGRQQKFGELAFFQENQIIRLSDGLALKKRYPRKEKKPASLHHQGFGD